MACDLATIQTQLCTSGIGTVTNPVTLLQIIAQLTCEASEGGGGGGGAVICGNYGGQPTFTPTTGCGVAVDTSDGTIYWYYSGAWHP